MPAYTNKGLRCSYLTASQEIMFTAQVISSCGEGGIINREKLVCRDSEYRYCCTDCGAYTNRTGKLLRQTS
ncbi:hypothetical protein CK934_27310 [Chitinophaga sp. MD30]|nr:hypothetical protein CK934_27310 [Chitinophaga sp. MD30]